MSQLQRIAIAPSQLQQGQILLTPEQQHYLLRVLRLREGDRFIAMDGQGKWWLTQLAGAQGQVLEPLLVETELPVSITLMVALPKGNGFDEVVRSCTELGVATIAPVLSDRTLLNPSPQKLERWRRIAAEAAEQSERSFVPTILEPVAFSTSLSSVTRTERSRSISHSFSFPTGRYANGDANANGFAQDKLLLGNSQQYICEARGNYPHLRDCLNNDKEKAAVIIATGPEGGWTEQEVEKAIACGFQPISLGRRILRAVTAPIVALSLITAAYEVS